MDYTRARVVSGWRYSIVRAAMALHIIYLAWKRFGNPVKALEIVTRLRRRAIINGYVFPRCFRIGNKYYGNLTMQGWPSAAFERYMEYNFDQVIADNTSSLHLAIFSVTHSCGFQCQHCLEWDRLNTRNDLTVDQILKVINNLHKNGVSQIMFSGGEPTTRLKDLLKVIQRAPQGIEFWMITNGFNITREKALELKNSGLTGMIISIDHPDPEQHDRFRGIKGSHENALNAIDHAHAAGLIPALSCCTTNDFVVEQNVRDYIEMAKRKDVAFIQFLEPKAIGRYHGQPVQLNHEKQKILEKIYNEINYSGKYADYPLITYVDYHERTHGCVAHAVNLLYVDAEGYAQNCPFCRGQKFSLLQDDITPLLSNMKYSSCSMYEVLQKKPAGSRIPMTAE